MEDIRFRTSDVCNISRVDCIKIKREKNYSFEFKNGKTNFTFVYVTNGKMKYIFKDESVFVDEGYILFVPKNLPYKSVYLEDNTLIKAISVDFSDDLKLQCLSKPMLTNTPDFVSIFDSVNESNMQNTIFLLSKAYELIYHLQNQGTSVPEKYVKIYSAINEIKRKYYENKPISYYASMCRMSESNFRRLFKEYTGKSPIDYRNEIRVFEAKKLVNSGEYTVHEAAYTVGFNNMSFYYDVVKKQTPSAPAPGAQVD